jgi:hypothetical protein
MENVEPLITQAEGAAKQMEGAAKKTASDVQSAFETYQRKLMDIATENMAFAMEFSHAMAAARSPTDFMNVTSDHTPTTGDVPEAYQRIDDYYGFKSLTMATLVIAVRNKAEPRDGR